MDKTGKSNVIFLILIPIFFIISLIIVDTFISYSENKRYKKITEQIILEVMNDDNLSIDDYYDEIKRHYEMNNFETDMLIVDASGYSVHIENEHRYFGIISSITNKDGEDEIVKILGVEFNVKKSSKAIIKIEAIKNNEEIEFNYTETE